MVNANDSYSDAKEMLIGEIPVTVVQSSRVFTNIYNTVISVMIMLNNINMGAAIDLYAIKSVLKKPIGPLVGALSQFVAMPLVKINEKICKEELFTSFHFDFSFHMDLALPYLMSLCTDWGFL